MSFKKTESRGFGPIALLIKLGPKIVKLVGPLFKTLKLGKVGLAAGSFGIYAVLFSWQFAAVLMGSLFLHEMGHVWAMRRYGMPVKGVYFIPFLGAAAVAENSFPSRKAETWIALAGPLVGLATALVPFGLYLATGSALAAAVAGWIGMVNLFNLLPINPLDGGRVMKSIASSLSSKLGFVFLAAGIVGTFALAWVYNFGLITFLLFFGSVELLAEIKNFRRDRDRKRIIAVLAEGLGTAPDADKVLDAIDAKINAAEGFDKYRYAQAISGTAIETRKPYKTLIRRREAWVVKESELSMLIKHDDTARDTSLGGFLTDRPMPAMTPRETLAGGLAYLVLAGLLVAVMAIVAAEPAASGALKVFMN